MRLEPMMILQGPLHVLIQRLEDIAIQRRALSNSELSELFMRAFKECGLISAQIATIARDIEELCESVNGLKSREKARAPE